MLKKVKVLQASLAMSSFFDLSFTTILFCGIPVFSSLE